MIKQWLMLGIAAGVFASCSQDTTEPNVSPETGETVTLGISAEVSVDTEGARALKHKLVENGNNQIVPMPEFADGEEVEVHTVIKSNRSGATPTIAALKWKYDAAKKKLVLSSGSHDLTIANFNNDNSTKWYISGFIGGVLSGTQIEFMGTRVLKGFNGNAGEALGSMDIPYAFGWTELTIETDKGKTANSNSYRFAKVDTDKNVKFQPMGTLLAVKLGNKQPAGAYTFTLKSFTLSSNAWYDQGTFELNTAIPATDPQKKLPEWKESTCAGDMYYTFASGHEPGTIAPNTELSKTHYVWVMPNQVVPTGAADVRVMFRGTSSRPESADYKDYTNIWFTDYTTVGKASQGKVTEGKVQTLRANASHRLALPIEYVTEYALAGGDGLTSVPPMNPLPAGVQGDLRFATSHRNDQSGYYNWYKVAGRHHAIYNPDTRNLQAEVDATFGADKYYIPTQDQWWGVFPTPEIYSHSWTAAAKSNTNESMRVGSGRDEFKQSYLSDYSAGSSVNDATSDATTYAIRFKARLGHSCAPIKLERWDYDAATATYRSHMYTSAPDNKLKCAYRFRRIGGKSAWDKYDNQNLTNQLIIDVVYLGEEATEDISAVSVDSWWSTKQAEGKVISRTFSAAGYLYGAADLAYPLFNRGYWGPFWTATQGNAFKGWAVYANGSVIDGSESYDLQHAKAVRLYSRNRN